MQIVKHLAIQQTLPSIFFALIFADAIYIFYSALRTWKVREDCQCAFAADRREYQNARKQLWNPHLWWILTVLMYAMFCPFEKERVPQQARRHNSESHTNASISRAVTWCADACAARACTCIASLEIHPRLSCACSVNARSSTSTNIMVGTERWAVNRRALHFFIPWHTQHCTAHRISWKAHRGKSHIGTLKSHTPDGHEANAW